MSELGRIVAERIALQLVRHVTAQGNIPFCLGDLRKSIVSVVRVNGQDYEVVVGSNLVYARAIHDGRPQLTIRARRKKALVFWAKGHGDAGRCRKKPFPTGDDFSQAIQDREIIMVKKVVQPARPANPYLTNGYLAMQRQGLGFLERDFKRETVRILEGALFKI